MIIVIQENRTPDNLFGSDAFAASPQLPGADLVQKGDCVLAQNQVTLTPFPLDACFDPDHGHDYPNGPDHAGQAWFLTYNGGSMNGACQTHVFKLGTCTNPPTYPQLTYVDNSSSQIQPYFDIAAGYGFANYMFQTNQGPSFPAHQFLFSGTSAPDYYNDPANGNCAGTAYGCWQWFVAENKISSNRQFGCTATGGTIYEIDPNNDVEGPGYDGGYPCYTHNTMPDLLENAYNRPGGLNGPPISWKYYPQGPSWSTSAWTAPNAISSICQSSGPGGSCGGSDWLNNVLPNAPNTSQEGGGAPIIEDIENCALPAVSWVVPDGNWSDHPGTVGHFKGPAWVTAIVNSVGAAKTCDGTGYWSDTVILITWDDWGGWYDHVMPLNCNPEGSCSGYSNLTGQQYVYGFRVPLLVVSAYNKRDNGFNNHISGRCNTSRYPGCPNMAPGTVHDFGSILNFIEYAFGTGGNPLYFKNYPPTSGINPDYLYADALAPDTPNAPNCSPTTCPYGLSDFFNFNQNPTHWPVGGISLPSFLQSYIPEWFETFGTHPGDQPADPDNDITDQ